MLRNNEIESVTVIIEPNHLHRQLHQGRIFPDQLKKHHINNAKGLGIPMHAVTEIETVEITKIVENANRYLQIAFAEELYLYCQENNLSFPQLRDALTAKGNINILEPREGIGGDCLPKDTKMFLQSSSRRLRGRILTAAIQADQDYRKYRLDRSKSNENLILEQSNIELTVTEVDCSNGKSGGSLN